MHSRNYARDLAPFGSSTLLNPFVFQDAVRKARQDSSVSVAGVAGSDGLSAAGISAPARLVPMRDILSLVEVVL